MVSKSLRVTPFLMVVICLSLAYFKTNARAQDPTTAAIVYSQPPNGALLPHNSSQLGYDRYGSDYDQYVWDNFTLSSTQAITQINWRGVYNSGGYWGGRVIDFIVGIYPSTASDTQPDHIHPPLVEYTLGGNAAETPAWTPGSVSMSLHDYTFTLPTPFTAIAGTKYWVQIEAIQNGAADWGIVAGTGGDGVHFYAVPGVGDYNFNFGPGDAAFTLLGPGNPAPPNLSINDAAVTEGNTGSVNAVFTVSLSAPSAVTATVNYATDDSTALAPDDYTAASGTLTFAPGVATRTLAVAVQGDTLDELQETFFVNLTNATHASIADSQGVGTIVDDDGAPRQFIYLPLIIKE